MIKIFDGINTTIIINYLIKKQNSKKYMFINHHKINKMMISMKH